MARWTWEDSWGGRTEHKGGVLALTVDQLPFPGVSEEDGWKDIREERREIRKNFPATVTEL